MDTTPVLGLRTNIGTDPFLREDFVFNWAKLDESPGVRHGSATDRSGLSWGAGQAGRLFLEQETQRLMQWTGSAWVEVLQNPESFGAVITSPTLGTPASSPTVAASATYSFPAVTLIRPGRLVGTMSLTWTCTMSHTIYLTFNPYVDGVSMSVLNGTHRRITVSTSGLNEVGTITVPFRSGVLAAGVHTPQIRLTAQPNQAGVANGAAYTAVVAN
jgi:hypothetical protein